MKRWIASVKQKRGETLVESMAAILVFTLASVLFLSTVTTAANINRTARDADEDFVRQQEKLELPPDSTDTNGSVKITVNSKDLATSNVIVIRPGAEGEESFYAYYTP